MAERTTAEERAAWAEAAAKATPGPWRATPREMTHPDGISIYCDTECHYGMSERVLLSFNQHFPSERDRRFIEAAREAVPALLAEHEAQARELAELRAKAEALTTERDALRSVGARMSNVCFNLKQGCSPLDGRARAAMADLHREYDAIPRALAPKEERDDGK